MSESVNTRKTAPGAFLARTGRWIKRIRAEWLLCAALLALTLYVVLYYITGPSLNFLHSDSTDSLLWAWATVDSGQILAEDFHYAALLPFGAPLWMVPILSIWGYTVTAQTVSMAVFAVLFVFSAFSLFRGMKWSPALSAVGAFCMSLLLSGSAKLREILWEHTIYYSLSILFVMLLLNLCLRLLPCLEAWTRGESDRRHTAKLVTFGVLLLLLSAGCATDGFQVLAVSVVPVLGALAAYTLLEDAPLLSRRGMCRYITGGLMLFGTAAGMLILRVITQNGQIRAGYGTAYSVWSDPTEWGDNAGRLVFQMLSLFGVDPAARDPLFTLESVGVLLKIVCVGCLLLCPLVLLFRYRRIRHSATKLILWTHLAVSAVVLLGFVCGSLSTANWRLTPMLGSAVLATLALLRELFSAGRVEKRLGAALCGLLVTVSLLNAYTICQMPRTLGQERDHRVIARTLAEKGYDYGYATFWNAQITTLLSDEQVTVLPVKTESNAVVIYPYQVRDSWFQSREGKDCFLLLTEGEYELLRYTPYWTALLEQRTLVEQWSYNGYHVAVFDGDVLIE